jgi:hypothetical protein
MNAAASKRREAVFSGCSVNGGRDGGEYFVRRPN